MPALSRAGSGDLGAPAASAPYDPSPKLAITVDPDVHAQVIAAAAADGVSVSAWMTSSARRSLRLREGLSRSPAQVQLRRLLRGCEVVPLTEQDAHSAGRLLGRAGSSDVVDAVVACTAAALHADVVTGDRAEIARLLDAAGTSAQIIDL